MNKGATRSEVRYDYANLGATGTEVHYFVEDLLDKTFGEKQRTLANDAPTIRTPWNRWLWKSKN